MVMFAFFCVRAAYFELVVGLDTQACLDSVHRFFAKSRKPMTMLFYTGTIFVGAANDFILGAQSIKEDHGE